MNRKKDIIDKGAVLQRDRETYCIIPHMPGGITTPLELKKLADVADKYNAQAIKLTSAQRIAIVGIKEEDIDSIWDDLGMKKGQAIGKAVKSIKFCPGTTFCKMGLQDSIAMGMELDKLYHGYELPSKFKMGVSGCGNSCAESWVKDIGLLGKKSGFEIVIGGNAGRSPRIADELYDCKSPKEALDIIADLLALYKEAAKTNERFSKFVNRMGIELIKKYLEATPEIQKEMLASLKEVAVSK